MEQKVLNRKFGLITGGGCLFIAAYQQVLRHHFTMVFTIAGALLVLIALTAPLALNPIRIVWIKIGDVLGAINTAIILFLVFFLVITPIALMMRLLGKQGLELKIKADGTYWKPTKTAPNSTLKQQF
jgi:hypothetical protein